MEIDKDINAENLKQAKSRSERKCSDEDILGLLTENGLTSRDWQNAACKQFDISSRTFASIRAALARDDLAIQSKINQKWLPCRKPETPEIEPF